MFKIKNYIFLNHTSKSHFWFKKQRAISIFNNFLSTMSKNNNKRIHTIFLLKYYRPGSYWRRLSHVAFYLYFCIYVTIFFKVSDGRSPVIGQVTNNYYGHLEKTGDQTNRTNDIYIYIYVSAHHYNQDELSFRMVLKK